MVSGNHSKLRIADARRRSSRPRNGPEGRPRLRRWTFLTHHAHDLLCIAQDSEIRLVDMARLVATGERAIRTIVTDLIEAGFVIHNKESLGQEAESCG